MFLAVGLQVAVVAVLAFFAGSVWGWENALSLAFGGGAVIVPNALFAARLAFQRGRPPESYLVVFFAGEFVKIGLTVAVLVLAARFVPQLRWLALVAGLIAAVHAPLLVPLLAARRKGGRTGDRQRQGDGRPASEPDANRPQPPRRENR